MEWLQSVGDALDYIEENLTEKLCVEDVADHVYASLSHFSRMFCLLAGITPGEYIRNRRLSLAGLELSREGRKVIDTALKYQYDTPESFSKAFSRFHGIKPSEARARASELRFYYPLTISLTIKGGFDMPEGILDRFCWNDAAANGASAEESYRRLVDWASRARGQNPGVFDALTEWLLDDSEWKNDKLRQNEQIFMNGVLARFREQNARLRESLRQLEPSGVVNAAIFPALDRFDGELSGHTRDARLQEAVSRMFKDFGAMRNRSLRALIAGGKTGASGTDSVETFGYVNILKECDAGVQWTLFMPDYAAQQQKGFKVARFEYQKLPAMRFIGFEGEEYEDVQKRLDMMIPLRGMTEYKTSLDFDALFMHHDGLCVDVGPWHGVWGRFMRADTPVPEGYVYFDFVPDAKCDQAGPPYSPRFAYAEFSGDPQALNRREGYDVDAMYDVTRNIILGQGVLIPYPEKYWTAAAFLNGCDHDCTAYLFSAEP